MGKRHSESDSSGSSSGSSSDSSYSDDEEAVTTGSVAHAGGGRADASGGLHARTASSSRSSSAANNGSTSASSSKSSDHRKSSRSAESSNDKSSSMQSSGSGGSASWSRWALLKKALLVISIATIGLNVHASKKLADRFALDYAEDVESYVKPIEAPTKDMVAPMLGVRSGDGAALDGGDAGGAYSGGSLSGSSGAAAGGGRARPPNKVLKILQLLTSVEKSLQPPPGLRRVVVLGKSFILKRDYSIWELIYGEAKFQVTSTNKQELAHEGPDTWTVMLCLDLFDGKSHCMEPSDLPNMRRWQKISRLIGLRKIIWNKDKFCETMGQSLKGFSNYTEFVFPCWILPHQFNDMIKDVREKYATDTRFILKPTDRGEGNGIIVMDNIKRLADWKASFPDNEEVVVQTYLNDPMLIKDRKWDMRTYILITSIHPLRMYMYRDGLVRFASTKYDKDAKDGGKKTAFLTNTSVNKKYGQSVEDLTWPYPQVYEYLKKQANMDPDVLWKRIERAIVQVIMSSEAAFLRRFKSIRNDYTCANCFQLLGVDVIVDASIVPRIIEVNGEPSMQLSGELNSHYDHTKKSMTHDLVQVLFTQDSYARQTTESLYELELDGWQIGYNTMGGCSPSDDICLRSTDLQYLIDFTKEEYNMGGFRRLYPCADGDYYSRYLQHLESKLPYGTLTSTARMHKLVTTLARRSKVQQHNSIADPSFFARQAALGKGDPTEDD